MCVALHHLPIPVSIHVPPGSVCVGVCVVGGGGGGIHEHAMLFGSHSIQAPRLAAQSAFVSALGRISKRLLKYRARDLRSE